MQALKVPELLLPRKDVDLKKWAVVACDQVFCCWVLLLFLFLFVYAETLV